MKQGLFFCFIAVCLFFNSCEKSVWNDSSLNQIPGKYFFLEEKYVEFPKDAYLQVNEEGAITISSISKKITTQGAPCINILISKSDYSLTNNTLTFKSTADLKLFFFSQRADIVFGDKEENVSATIKGSIDRESSGVFFSEDGKFEGSVSFIISTEDKEHFYLLFNRFSIGTIGSLFLDPDAH